MAALHEQERSGNQRGAKFLHPELFQPSVQGEDGYDTGGVSGADGEQLEKNKS